MSYPPTPDPFSLPSSRTLPRLDRQSSGTGSDQSSNDSLQPPPARSMQFASSSADLYSSSGSTDHLPSANLPASYERIRGSSYNEPSTYVYPALPYSASSHQIGGPTSSSESAPMLVPTSTSHPLLPAPARAERPFSRSMDAPFRGYHQASESYNGSNYGGFQSHSRDPSAMNASLASSSMLGYDEGDDQCQRGLYSGVGSSMRHERMDSGGGGGGGGGGRGARRSSNMQSHYEDDGNEKPYNTSPTISSEGKRSKGSRWSRLSKKAKWYLVVGLLLALIILGAIAGTTISLLTKHTSNVSNSGAGAAGGASSATVLPTKINVPTTTQSAPVGVPTISVNWKTAAIGADGSTVYAAGGDVFRYNNTFGGFWNAIPFNDSAQVASDVPPLNQAWDYSVNKIHGVNLGGWLVIEPFITPALFEPYTSGDGGAGTTNQVADEWTLCLALGTSMAATIENHYATFITERDFAEIAAAGLNWVRIPIPYWIIEVYPGEPFLANVGWTYFLLALSWARKYGLRVNLDLHAVPGSQNGFNHSSKLGTINFLSGIMGIANVQRTMNYIRTLTEFISQDNYKNVVPMFGILNEPAAFSIGMPVLRSFYLDAYLAIRSITGYGAGAGPMIAIHDGFQPIGQTVADGGWLGFMTGADRLALDTHPYLCFTTPNAHNLKTQASQACQNWNQYFNNTRTDFGVYFAGEFSLAINDCGKWINNIGNGARYDGTYTESGATSPKYAAVGDCAPWNDWENYSADTTAGLMNVALANMDALGDWFYWTWKTGASSITGAVTAPLWNYQLALKQGYIPSDPRSATGMCPVIVAANDAQINYQPFVPPFSAWQTGSVGTVSPIANAVTAAYSVFPPLSLGATPIMWLPTYTATQAITTLPPPATPTSFPLGYSTHVSIGNGWINNQDTAAWNTPVSGCSYPNPWSGYGAAVPTTLCPPGIPVGYVAPVVASSAASTSAKVASPTTTTAAAAAAVVAAAAPAAATPTVTKVARM